MLGEQGALEIVQRKILAPTPRLVTVVLGLAALVIVPEPLTNDHCPVPMTGALAAMVAELTLRFWLGPALAMVGAAEALCNSCTPKSVFVPKGRAFPKRSVAGAPVLSPRFKTGEQSVR